MACELGFNCQQGGDFYVHPHIHTGTAITLASYVMGYLIIGHDTVKW
jgi:hypothetical protein